METLGLDEQYVRRCEGRRKLDEFLTEAQRAWSMIWGLVDEGRLNPIIWLRDLFQEARSIGLWVPRPFILRLRQLERGDLVISTGQWEPVKLPPHSGLPKEFRECCEFLNWNFWWIVPGLRKGEFTSCCEGNCETDETQFVAEICKAWESLPAGVVT